MDNSKKVILWSAPRCLTNAFTRSIMTLKKGKYFKEAFCGPYYFGPNHCSELYPKLQDFELDMEGLSTKDLTYETIMKLLTAEYPDVDLVFTKEFAYCVPESMYQDLVSNKFTNLIHTFLIRDPERALYSNYNTFLKYRPQQDYMDPPNGGFYELLKLYQFVKEAKGVTPVVVDATDLQTHPDKTMKAYCEAVGIPFDPNMTSWEPGPMICYYKIWIEKWTNEINHSSGFIKATPESQKPVPLHELPREVVKCIEDSRVHYTEMRKDCIKPLNV